MTGKAAAALAGALVAGLVLIGQAFAASQAPQPAADPFHLSGDLRQGALVRGLAPPGAAGLSLDGKPVPVDSTGAFIIGFDRDAPARSVLTATRRGGAPVSEELSVARRDWPIEHVDVARIPEKTPPEEFLRVRKQELARIEAARSLASNSNGWRQEFILPARGRISGLFGSQRIYRGEPAAFHSGLDIAAGAGADVVAPADGVVVLAGPPAFTLEGNLVIVDHGMGLNSAFLHLSSEDVRVGDRVRQGQKIGTVGMTGRATGPHLHWSVKWRDARLDPQLLVGAASPPPNQPNR